MWQVPTVTPSELQWSKPFHRSIHASISAQLFKHKTVSLSLLRSFRRLKSGRSILRQWRDATRSVIFRGELKESQAVKLWIASGSYLTTQTQIDLFICISPWVNLGGLKTRFHNPGSVIILLITFPLDCYLHYQPPNLFQKGNISLHLCYFSIISPLITLFSSLKDQPWPRWERQTTLSVAKPLSSEKLSATGGGKPNNLERVQESFVTRDVLNKHWGTGMCHNHHHHSFPLSLSLSGQQKAASHSAQSFSSAPVPPGTFLK